MKFPRWRQQREAELDNVPSLISAVSAMRISGVNLRAGSHVQYLQAGRVSAHYFNVLALHPIIGRNFTEDEDRPHGPRTAILSYALWRTAFGGNRNVLGQTVLLKGELYTIIGVLPENANTPFNADVYVVLMLSGVTLLATIVPTLRVARIDPAKALREA